MSTTNLFRHLMRLLTPDEIQELSTIFHGANQRPLTDFLIEKIDEETREEICNLGEHAENTRELEERLVAQRENKLVPSSSTSEEETKKGVVFILDLKKKLEKAQRALKEKEVLGLYQKAAGLDVDFSKANKDDLKKSNNLGVLINKKQY